MRRFKARRHQAVEDVIEVDYPEHGAVVYGRVDATSDPRSLGGQIAGPGGAYERDAVVVDTRRAVLLAHSSVATFESAGGESAVALVMSGRINQSTADDVAEVMFLMNADGAAALASEIVGLMGREAGDLRDEFMAAFSRRMAELP